MAQYTPKTWTTGETITAAELNAIEQAAAAAAVKADLATVATSGSYTDLTSKPSIPAAYTDEQAQDAVAAAFAAGTQTGVTVAYNDAANSLSITATGSTSPNATTTSPGIVQLAGDLAGTATAPTVPGLASKLDKATADGLYVAQANAIDLESTQDSIAGMFTGGTHSGISFAYNDPGNVINATVTPGAVADATTTAKGAIQLAGDLAGTAAAPTVPALANKAPLLVPTATKTAAYTAVVGDLAMMNVAGGGTTLTLPTAPANKAQVGYRAIGATSGTPLTVNRGGTDTIGTAGATSASVIFADETVVLQYDAPNTRWLGITSVRSQASMDARYDLSGAASTAQAFAIQRANHTGTQSADTLTDGTTNKAFLATERTKLTGIATGATANPNAVASTTVTTIVTLTAAAYTALGTKDSATVYIVTP